MTQLSSQNHHAAAAPEVSKTSADELVGLQEAMRMTTMSRASIYREMQASRRGDGEFPQPVKIGRRSAWSRNELNEWIEGRKAARVEC